MAVQEVVRTAEAANDVDQPLPMPQGVSDLAVGVTNGSEPELIWVTAILIAALASVAAMRLRVSRDADSIRGVRL